MKRLNVRQQNHLNNKFAKIVGKFIEQEAAAFEKKLTGVHKAAYAKFKAETNEALALQDEFKERILFSTNDYEEAFAVLQSYEDKLK